MPLRPGDWLTARVRLDQKAQHWLELPRDSASPQIWNCCLKADLRRWLGLRRSADSDPQFPDTNALAALKVQVDPGFSGTQTAATAAISGAGQSPYVYTNTLVVADVGEMAGITRFTQRFTRRFSPSRSLRPGCW